MENKYKQFPGGSKARVNKAGENIRSNKSTEEDLYVIDAWRAAHRSVLNTFQAILRKRTKGTEIVVAQRHKRRLTIYDKLKRFPEMQLARMDDVAGCRLIFDSINELYSFRSSLHNAHFRHKLRNEIDKYDYIKQPKKTGYRGSHDVYEYDVNSLTGRMLKGLVVEIQYRTKIQHAWATTVEVIGFITESQPKFQKGDKRYEKAMVFASEILARAYENHKGALFEIDDKTVVEEFLKYDNELNLLQTLRGLNISDLSSDQNRNTILIFSKSGELKVLTFRDTPEALRMLFKLEKESPDKDIVLVKADSSDDVRLAFKNYFSDSKDFVNLVEKGCEKLSLKKVLNVNSKDVMKSNSKN